MRFGLCVGGSAENVKIAAAAGYDYVEAVFGLLADTGEEEFERFASALDESGVRCEAVNCFIPGSLPLIGPDVDDARLTEFIERGMKRGERIGLRTVVFGSGAARRMPDGWLYGDAVRQLVHFLREVVTPLAEKYGLTVVVEPLCDTNTVTTVREGAMLTAFVNTEPVKMLCDLYHMYQVGEGVEALTGTEGMLAHSHIAEPDQRGYPKSTDEYDYQTFVNTLEKLGCPRCSVEAGTQNFAQDAANAIAVLRAL